jgi:hypothetical protein
MPSPDPRDRSEALDLLALSFRFSDQMSAREVLKAEERLYNRRILEAYLVNPFLRLTHEEAAHLQDKVTPPALGQLIAARHAATGMATPKYVVFCMPKSGSSFVQSALAHALQLPFVSLTTFGKASTSSHFGMNGREQELDELALVKSAVTAPTGFVAQHHTRYTSYLSLQAQLYGLTPIVTVRNALDCIVSFDDMMLDWRANRRNVFWMADAQFALPRDYETLDDDARYTLLTHSFGVWLINFYLSWKRGQRQRLISPVMIRYEDHVLDREKLVEELSVRLRLSNEQRRRLRDYAEAPDREKSRLNVGQRGRGDARLPDHLKDFLANYARMFAGELDDEDIRYLVH